MKYRHISFLSLTVSILFCLMVSVQPTCAESDFPETYRVLIDHSDNQILLLGNSDSTGESTLITLPATARFVQAKQVRKNSINYLVVLYTAPRHRDIYLRLYHPDGTQIAQRTALHTTSSRRFSTMRIDTRRSNGETTLLVRAIKQTNRGKTMRYHVQRYRVHPTQQQRNIDRIRNRIKRIKRPPTSVTGNRGTVRWMNYYRKQSGLLPVQMRSSLSRGCQAHIDYMEVHGLTHIQDSSQAEYSQNGAEAGLASDLAVGTSTMLSALDLWLSGPYHRFPIFAPALTHVGLGYAADTRYSCLHLGTTDSAVAGFPYDPIAYPAPGETHVPTTFESGESPDPLSVYGGSYPAGQVVSLIFASGVDVEQMTVTVRNESGTILSGYTQIPDDESNPLDDYQGNAVTFIPHEPLSSGTQYRVHMRGTVDGSNFSKRWRFTTE